MKLHIIALALVVTACSNGKHVSPTPAPFPLARDLSSLVQSVPLIIVGRVAGVQPGRTAGEGETRLQFNDVQVSVEKWLKGDTPTEVLVEQLAIAGRTVTSEVGPAYKPGERYVLFLRPGEGNRYITVTQGRYLLRRGRVHPTEPGLVADKMKGMDEAKFVEKIEALVQSQVSGPVLNYSA